jgi:prefoldin subunit 5
MAKKSTALVNAVTAASTAAALIGLSVQAGTQEVIDIKIAQLEADLDAQIDKLQGKAKQLEAEVKTATTALNKLVTDFGNTKFKASADAAVAALVSLGCSNANLAAQVRTNYDTQKRTLTVQPGIGHYMLDFRAENYAFTDDMITQVKVIDTNGAELSGLYSQIAKLKQQLAMIPKYERKIRAVIGRTKLEESEEGRALLQKVMDINLLPQS